MANGGKWWQMVANGGKSWQIHLNSHEKSQNINASFQMVHQLLRENDHIIVNFCAESMRIVNFFQLKLMWQMVANGGKWWQVLANSLAPEIFSFA